MLRLLLLILFLFVPFLNSAVKSEEVGYGRHIKEGEKITKMGEAQRIVNKNEEIKEYKDVGDNACDLTLDDNGNIILHYKNDGIIKDKGCAVDMLTTKNWSNNFEFTATIMNGNSELKNCLISAHDGFNFNKLPFAYSIGLDEFEEFKKGPRYDLNLKCRCKEQLGGCLKRTGMEIGWRYTGYTIRIHIEPIGEPLSLDREKDKITNEMSESKVQTKEDKNNYSLLFYEFDAAYCLLKENIVEPKAWEIIDEKHKNKEFNYLFVFYLLPQNATFIHSRDNNGWSIKKGETPSGPKCKDIQIKFNGSYYKLLMNGFNNDENIQLESSTKTFSTKTTKESIISIKSTSTIIKTTTNILTTKNNNNLKWYLIGGIVGIILIILIICGVILFILMINKEDNNEETKGENNLIKEMSTNVGM
ncbi:hypothetical protein ACQ4LE_010576, partial [Meloidogyne hapla]